MAKDNMATLQNLIPKFRLWDKRFSEFVEDFL